MSLLPEISQASAEINKLVAQANIHQTIAPVDPAAFTDPADTALLASRDPVIREVSVGMTGEAYSDYSVSGTPPLSLTNSLGKPLKAWSVDVLPYQEGSGDPAPDNVRPIHGTDKLTIYTDSKYGGLVEWNQQVKNGNFEGTTSWSTSNVTINATDHVMTMVKAASTAYGTGYVYQYVPMMAGHKYFETVDYRNVSNTTRIRVFYFGSENIDITDTDWHNVSRIAARSISESLQLMLWNMSENSNEDMVMQVRNCMIFDLTQMFGAGNEPSSVAEFRALFPLDYYPYNAGQQMTVDQVNGAQYSPAVLTLPQTVYTGTIGSEGGESRWGEVDLGTLNWTYDDTTYEYGYFQTSISDKALSDSNNFLCEAYANATGTRASLQNNQIARRSSSTKYVCIRNDNYSDTAAFTASVQGIKLIYEVDTPTDFTITAPTIPTPTGTATTWATAEDGMVESMEVTYVGKA